MHTYFIACEQPIAHRIDATFAYSADMLRRPLPTEEEARRILAQRKTRPPMRPPPRASRSLAPFIKKLDEQFGRGASALEGRWPEIVGERLAKVCRPMKLVKGRGNAGGVLELRVVGPAALLVQHQTQDIIDRVNLFLGSNAVEKLRISQGPVKPLSTSSAAPKSRQRPALPPMPPAAEAELEQKLDHVDEGLKAALMKLGRAAMARTAEQGDDPYR